MYSISETETKTTKKTSALMDSDSHLKHKKTKQLLIPKDVNDLFSIKGIRRAPKIPIQATKDGMKLEESKDGIKSESNTRSFYLLN